MDFQIAKQMGYYFDRCIDLTFYDSDMNYIGKLKTPTRGLKPTIVIKGLLVEGGYAIDSYISVQNMAFDIDIAYIGFIKAKMYYSGLEESLGDTLMSLKLKQGHTILYRVLYADQEKEPPNRCVRFQCVVACKDITMYNTNMYVTGGKVNFLTAGTDASSLVKIEKNKAGSKAPLKKVCEELITVYNTGVLKNSDAGTKTEYVDNMKITVLEIEAQLENLNVQLSSGQYSLGDFIRQLNSNASETTPNGVSYSRFKIVIDRGCMRVSTPVPKNWKDVAKSKGIPESGYEQFYNDTYISAKTNTYNTLGALVTKEKLTPVVPLNFVKSATRSENLVYIETLFDDRITPGCHVSIRSNAIMGKKFGSKKGNTKGSRILQYLNEDKPITIRNTGKIEYLFSTTEDSYMKLQGPIDQSAEAEYWSRKAGAIYE